ncbi:MAG: hypothetical protein M1834_002699 [Cirrosporium novae-zelandiae]|nr:MAG: hypothetical protein M1834_002699 [Cirrosporium novae-zelandiae]
MANDPGGRRLLPQTAQMQTFSFTPPSQPPPTGPKNYVFVDEHNRHKRLKVMRACEGCRRRKIKCDAATTNTWPCSACTRLKLTCVPPTIKYEHDNAIGQQQHIDNNSTKNLQNHTESNEHSRQVPVQSHFVTESRPPQGLSTPPVTYGPGIPDYQPTHYAGTSNNQNSVYPDLHTSHMNMHTTPYTNQPLYQPPPPQPIQPSSGGEVDGYYHQDSSTASTLSDVLGELKIDETGVAPYISHQRRTLAEVPATEDVEVKLPPMSTPIGSAIRIPPELMPSEDQASRYFEFFFQNIHPYVPVLNRSLFYHQWHNNRGSISPLVLEALFACTGRLMDEDPSQGAQWLALASKHEDSFMDVPRLSTLQALLLLLKAREATPKRGYYYRSWMMVKTLVSMAKDLELQEHYALHQDRMPCTFPPVECLTRTRIWQCIFIVEVMIGAPQGRFDMGADPETVDVNVQTMLPGVDETEDQISRQFTYWVRCVRNVRMMHEAYAKIRKQKDWGGDRRFVELNLPFSRWMEELPRELQLSYPVDGSPPWIPSHFVANLHSYYHLAVMLLHRPQLMNAGSYPVDGAWKEHMLLCYSSAKSLCRLQEAVLQSYGLAGLLCMQRGINFTIYTVLTSIMLHLVATTSPDPDINSDAKPYFTRHMRVLEQCSAAWPNPEMQVQIDTLRQAFSADLSKPFELKPSFPYGSPGMPLHPSPPMDSQYHPALNRAPQQDSQFHAAYHTQTLTPPISATRGEAKEESPAAQSLVMMASQRAPAQSSINQLPNADGVAWNPTRIFDQWNSAFPSPNANSTNSLSQGSSPPMPLQVHPGNHDVSHYPDTIQSQSQVPLSLQTLPQPQPYSQANYSSIPSFVTPSEWQQSVASVYDPAGLKRRWDGATNGTVEPVAKRAG